MTISELRKQVRVLGFSLRISTLYYGKHAHFYRGKELLPTVFSGKSHLAQWQPLIDFLSSGIEVLDETGAKVYGIKIKG